MFVDGEVLGVAQARVKQHWDKASKRELQRSHAMYVRRCFTAFGSLGVVLRCHEMHEEDSL